MLSTLQSPQRYVIPSTHGALNRRARPPGNPHSNRHAGCWASRCLAIATLVDSLPFWRPGQPMTMKMIVIIFEIVFVFVIVIVFVFVFLLACVIAFVFAFLIVFVFVFAFVFVLVIVFCIL